MTDDFSQASLSAMLTRLKDYVDKGPICLNPQYVIVPQCTVNAMTPEQRDTFLAYARTAFEDVTGVTHIWVYDTSNDTLALRPVYE